MRHAFLALVIVMAAAPAFAADPAATGEPLKLRAGSTIRDANSVRLGRIDSVKPDGSVSFIFNSRFVVLPANSLSMVDGAVVTKLTKAEVKRLK